MTNLRSFNSNIDVKRVWQNKYRVKMTGSLLRALNSAINVLAKPDTTQQNNEQPATSIAGGSSDVANNIFNFVNSNIGRSFDPDGVYGAQCVDLIHQISIQFGLGLNTSGSYAYDIGHNAVPAGWQNVATNRGNQEQVWKEAPIGSIFWWHSRGGAALYGGHTGIKASEKFADTLSQNVDGGWGGPIRRIDLSSQFASGYFTDMYSMWIPPTNK